MACIACLWHVFVLSAGGVACIAGLWHGLHCLLVACLVLSAGSMVCIAGR